MLRDLMMLLTTNVGVLDQAGIVGLVVVWLQVARRQPDLRLLLGAAASVAGLFALRAAHRRGVLVG